MGYATLAQARGWIESGFGECQEDKLTRAVNLIRQHMFGWFRDLALFMDACECFQVQDFLASCNDCNDAYRGITLPREMQQVEALWHNDFPIRLYSGWREFQQGISPECACGLEKFDVPGTFSTVADINPNRALPLVVRAFNEADAGKRFVIRGRAVSGQPFTHEFVLEAQPQTTPMAVKSIDRGGILKSVTTGRVVLAQEGGRVLGVYEPEQTVPSFRRIKISGLHGDCDVVNVRASRRYYPLLDSDDVVETDNEVAFDAMARYLRLYQQADKSGSDMKAEKDFYATAMSMMLGEKKRDEGRGTRADLKIASPSFGGAMGSKLNRFGARYLF